MKRDVVRGLVLLALVAAACAEGAPADSRNFCNPNAYFYCRCPDGGDGSKQCNAEGTGFGECQNCQQNQVPGDVCEPGTTVACLCGDGTMSGVQACNFDGTGYEDACLGCLDGRAGEGGSGGRGGGGGGAGGGPGGSGGAGDQCPGVDLRVEVSAQPAVVFGTTAGMADDLQGADLCAETQPGADVVYRITPAGTGTLTATVAPTEAGFDPMVYARRGGECVVGAQFGCRDGALAGGDEALAMGVNADEPFYLVVDGSLGTSGAFKLSMSLSTAAVCGDGAVVANEPDGAGVPPDEQCDDGNRVDGDFCSKTCTATIPVGAGKAGCGNGVPGGGVPVHVFDDVVTVNGNTTSTGNNATASAGVPGCDVAATGAANDAVFQVVPHRSGTLSARLDPAGTPFDSVLYVRAAGCTAPEVDCDDKFSPQVSGEFVQASVIRDQPVWVVVDGFGATNKGAFRLQLSVE